MVGRIGFEPMTIGLKVPLGHYANTNETHSKHLYLLYIQDKSTGCSHWLEVGLCLRVHGKCTRYMAIPLHQRQPGLEHQEQQSFRVGCVFGRYRAGTPGLWSQLLGRKLMLDAISVLFPLLVKVK